MILSIFAGLFLWYFLSEFAFIAFGFGLGIEYTEEIILGHRGITGIKAMESFASIIMLSIAAFIPIYHQIRKIRYRNL
ncbi:MAG: hypothetical protein HQK76_19895 [Desulfobacterales bacterium]|nr:hypothetical protein [Desulfobacterales bacterium]